MTDSLSQLPILDQLSALADGLRSRLVRLLEHQELTVSELCEIVQLPQSTVSRHLKTLSDGHWVTSRPDGPRRLYRLPLEELSPSARKLWRLTRDEIGDAPAARQDSLRLEAVLSERRGRTRAFFATAAGGWDRLRDEMFGRRFYLLALAGLIDPDWVVADLGCGTGPVAEALAPWAGRVIGVDGSKAMVDAAKERLYGVENVEIRHGELEALPLDDQSVDAATLILVLHHLPEPARALSEVARVLRPGGRLLVVDMLPHDHLEYRQEIGHVWMGFAEEQIETMIRSSGMRKYRSRPLPVETEGRGPALFAATAVAPEETANT